MGGFAVAAGAVAAPARSASAACTGLSGPVRWIVPNAPGGGYDTLSRLLEPYLETALGASIQIDNVPGGGGLRGATMLSRAQPDGATLGIVNIPGLVMAAIGDEAALNPASALTLLGTVACSHHVWATGQSSGIESIEDAMRIGRAQGLVFAVNSFNSLGFFNAAVACAALGLRAEIVTGYGGSQASALAAIRGEVDLVSHDAGTQAARTVAGDLRPILRVGSPSRDWGGLYDALPTLTGPGGLAASRGRENLEVAEALVRFTAAGRVIAAPPRLPDALGRCLRRAACQALRNPALERAAEASHWTLDSSCADATVERVMQAKIDAARLAPIARAAIARTRA